ncbi:MAG: thiamine pyrophosphate-binding protein [Gammaproteobacteria bacterium]|nr:thiamine pyrophosphate-binding protein [Gammaproteobacteria bacterium]
MKIQVSEFIVRYLQRLGIKCIFGMPGAHILPVYDQLYDSPITAVLAKHEQGAAFMACGYARASGEISACITTAGPRCHQFNHRHRQRLRRSTTDFDPHR